jgi:hypothetical protein
MRCKLILILIFGGSILIAHSSIAASNDTLPTSKKNISSITLMDGNRLNGYIIAASDSTITFLDKGYLKEGFTMRSSIIPAENILEINKKFKKGITTGGGILAGFLVGTVIGFGIGLNQDCNNPDQDGKCNFIDKLFSTKNFRTSFILAGGLGTVGALLGLTSPTKSRARFIINGKGENIRSNKNGLLFY